MTYTQDFARPQDVCDFLNENLNIIPISVVFQDRAFGLPFRIFYNMKPLKSSFLKPPSNKIKNSW
jgi:hypothetical protein